MGLQMKTLIALSVGACALLWSGNIPLNKATSGVSLVSTAEARTTSVNTQGRTGKRRPNRGDRHGTRSYH
jgi:hypothetical protein